jgi:hypothetical protein
MRKLRNDNKLLNKKDEIKSTKPKETPKLQGNYSNKITPGQNYIKNKITEKYHQTTPQSRNFQSSESYEYHSEYKPYNQTNQNSSEKHYYSSNQYFTSNKNINTDYNLNNDGFYSTNYKKMIFGNTDLRNEYSPIADARVNIRKKLLEEKNYSQAYMTSSDDELLENFQFRERKNIRNNSEQKYNSIVRIIGYSNVIPIHSQRMISNLDLNQNVKEYNKKIEHNYIQKSNVQQVQKKEFKKPAQIETVKKQEIIKKYEIKKPEIKKEENKYKQYERKKEETVKKEVKKTEVVKKKEVKIENKKEIKKEVKEPKIIKRKENIKATFTTHSGRYKYTGNISNDIMNARKNYKQNSEEKNRKKVVIVEKSSKSAKKTENKTKISNTTAIKTNTVIKKEVPKTEVKKTEIKREEKTKIVSNVKPKEIKKIDISKNVTNYKRVKEESKTVQNSPKKMVQKRNIQVKTESYGNIEDIYKRENIDLAKIINIREVNRLYEMRKKKRNSTPKMKTKKINLGDNYKYYERKYMQSPDENYCTIHQRRNQRIIYGEQILESDGKIKMKFYKTKPLIREERYNKQLIDNSKIPSFNNNYMSYNKIYQNNWGKRGNKSEQYYYEQSSSYN